MEPNPYSDISFFVRTTPHVPVCSCDRYSENGGIIEKQDGIWVHWYHGRRYPLTDSKCPFCDDLLED